MDAKSAQVSSLLDFITSVNGLLRSIGSPWRIDATPSRNGEPVMWYNNRTGERRIDVPPVIANILRGGEHEEPPQVPEQERNSKQRRSYERAKKHREETASRTLFINPSKKPEQPKVQSLWEKYEAMKNNKNATADTKPQAICPPANETKIEKPTTRKRARSDMAREDEPYFGEIEDFIPLEKKNRPLAVTSITPEKPMFRKPAEPARKTTPNMENPFTRAALEGSSRTFGGGHGRLSRPAKRKADDEDEEVREDEEDKKRKRRKEE